MIVNSLLRALYVDAMTRVSRLRSDVVSGLKQFCSPNVIDEIEEKTPNVDTLVREYETSLMQNGLGPNAALVQQLFHLEKLTHEETGKSLFGFLSTVSTAKEFLELFGPSRFERNDELQLAVAWQIFKYFPMSSMFFSNLRAKVEELPAHQIVEIIGQLPFHSKLDVFERVTLKDRSASAVYAKGIFKLTIAQGDPNRSTKTYRIQINTNKVVLHDEVRVEPWIERDAIEDTGYAGLSEHVDYAYVLTKIRQLGEKWAEVHKFNNEPMTLAEFRGKLTQLFIKYEKAVKTLCVADKSILTVWESPNSDVSIDPKLDAVLKSEPARKYNGRRELVAEISPSSEMQFELYFRQIPAISHHEIVKQSMEHEAGNIFGYVKVSQSPSHDNHSVYLMPAFLHEALRVCERRLSTFEKMV